LTDIPIDNICLDRRKRVGIVLLSSHCLKGNCPAGCWWLTLVILAIQEAGIRKITVQSWSWANSSGDPILKKPITIKGSSKCETLSSNPVPSKKKKKKRKRDNSPEGSFNHKKGGKEVLGRSTQMSCRMTAR
jgi:hypothetical protein